ncbi:hypothetical protein FQA39_LY13293 [Lamprigera yunnana]|nr:hypothetical protein FQA39_LY13293 [Lamprigera yunnana]
MSSNDHEEDLKKLNVKRGGFKTHLTLDVENMKHLINNLQHRLNKFQLLLDDFKTIQCEIDYLDKDVNKNKVNLLHRIVGRGVTEIRHLNGCNCKKMIPNGDDRLARRWKRWGMSEYGNGVRMSVVSTSSSERLIRLAFSRVISVRFGQFEVASVSIEVKLLSSEGYLSETEYSLSIFNFELFFSFIRKSPMMSLRVLAPPPPPPTPPPPHHDHHHHHLFVLVRKGIKGGYFPCIYDEHRIKD